VDWYLSGVRLIPESMLKNFITVALRNLLRHKVYSMINVAGLTIGIACCLLISLYVRDEVSYDQYHKNIRQMYRLVYGWHRPGEKLAPNNYWVWGSSVAGSLLTSDFPEIKKVAQFSGRREMLFNHGDTRFQERNIFYADSTVFDIFSWNMLEGNPQTALIAPYTIVLTQSTAKRYFGDTDALGQTMVIDNGAAYKVTGVVADIPSNSHFTFDALISSTTWRHERPDDFKYWGYVDFYTYFLADENFDRTAFEAKIPAFLKRHNGYDPGYTFSIEPVSEVYLHSQAGRQPGETGSLPSLYIFSTIAIFILVIACINFMNLSTARSLDRAKEVGVRKTVGANRTGLIQQFLCESVLLSAFATWMAVTLASLSLNGFQQLSGKSFTVASLLAPDIILLLVAGALVVGLLAGTYPAFVLAGFKPSQVLKGVFKNSARGIFLRKGLVVFQFGLSVALITGSVIVYRQLGLVRTTNLGFTKEQMLIIDFGGDGKVEEQITPVKAALARIPGVASISAQRTVPGGFFPKAGTEVEAPDGKMENKAPDLYEVDYDFISNFKIPMVAGRDFSRDFISDSAHAMILNESAARDWGYKNPNDIIGKKFSQWGKEGMVIGVVKNFNYRSLHNQIEPLSLRLTPQWSTNSIAMRLSSTDIPSTVAAVEKTWKEIAPQRPFIYSFMDDSFNKEYQRDERFGNLFNVFSALAIFIACIGLFGLTTYVVEQRTKEIGIRKVLGAEVSGLVALLSKDFIKLVIIAIVIGTPLALYAMKQWLNGFAYQFTPGPATMIVPGMAVIIVALAIVGWKASQSAMNDPVKSLRND
jgi:putative ABC transport system permease protein